MPLIAHLIRERLVSQKEAKLLEKSALSQGCTLIHALLGIGLFAEGPLADWVAERTGCTRLSPTQVPLSALRQNPLLPLALMETLEILPLSLQGTTLTVATLDPTDRKTRAHLRFFTPYRLQAQVLSRSEITHLLQQLTPTYQPKSYEWGVLRTAFAQERRQHAAEITGETSTFAWLDEMAAAGLFTPEPIPEKPTSPSLWEEIRTAEETPPVAETLSSS